MNIISRSQWGAQPWRGQPYDAEMHERTHFLVHYHGGIPRHDRGDANAREIEAIHLSNGWSGVGYNFIVGQDGAIREGRGWTLVGAHCPGKNRTGIGVYVAIGGDQEPTEAAKRAVRWLYEEACRKTGKTLATGVHGDYYPTACAGSPLTAWVRAGMPVKGAPATRDALTIADLQELLGVPADGVVGPVTQAAVRDLQAALGIATDGDPGPTTMEALMSLLDRLDAIEKKIDRLPTLHDRIPLSQHTKDTAGTSLESISVGGALQYVVASAFVDPRNERDLAAIRALLEES